MKHEIIKAVKLCKTYYTGEEKLHAIQNVDLAIYQNDFTVIMGDSGSGKSTLLYLLSGLDNITVGEVYFGGKRIDQYGEAEIAKFRTNRIGYIYQGIHLVPDLTILENITFPAYIAGYKKKEVEGRALELMKAMGIEKLARRLPSQVSGGQQQRAAIARAMINKPEVLFADEPTGSLNHDTGLAILDLFTKMHLMGQSIVMVTHDLKAACRADRIIFVKNGQVDGTLELGRYDAKDKKSRENIIFSYLSRKEE